MKKFFCLCLVTLLILSVSGCNYHNDNLIEAPNGVKLPAYTKLELTKTEYIVSDEYLNQVLEDLTKDYATVEVVTTGIVTSGDECLNITYKTYVGEQMLAEAAKSDFTFNIGEGKFVKEFESALIGKELGKEFEVTLSYPLGSTYTIVDGKTVTHKITVNKIYKTVYPQLTDDFIQKHVEKSTVKAEAACKTIDEYRNYLKTRYQFMYEKLSKESLVSDILDTLMESAVFPEIDSKEIDEYEEAKYKYYVNYCKENGYSIETYFEQENITESDFRTQLRKDGEELIKKTMLIDAIQSLEGLDLTDEAYDNYLNYLKDYYQFDSVDDLKKSIQDLNVENTIKNDAIHNLVYDFLISNQNLKIEEKNLYDLMLNDKEG